jgi:hypothetical protein
MIERQACISLCSLPLQRKLNAVKSAIEQLVKRLSSETDLSLASVKRNIKQQLSGQSLIDGISLVVNIGQQQHFYSSSGATSTTACPLEKKEEGWQSQIISNEPPIPSFLYYRYVPEGPAVFQFVCLAFNVKDFIESFYDPQLSPVYRVILDDQNRIAYHPDSRFINKQSDNLLILDPLMALVSKNEVVQMNWDDWPIEAHISELEDGQWKIATLSSQANNPRKNSYQQHKISKLEEILAQTKQMVRQQTHLAKEDPNELLRALKANKVDYPTVTRFYFSLTSVDSTTPDCLFDTTHTLTVDAASLVNCFFTSRQRGNRCGFTTYRWMIINGVWRLLLK